MADEFIIIGVTLPDSNVPDEAAAIVSFLSSGAVRRMHLRKPYAGSEAALRRLLEEIPEAFHPRLSLHDAPSLLDIFPAVGFHLNSRHQSGIKAPVLSRSCHSAEEVLRSEPGLNYVTLSPVYDSISKSGYCGRHFDRESEAVMSRRVIALGGIVPSRFGELKERGFHGAAMLGYLWDFSRNRKNIIAEINETKSYVTVHN